MLYLQGVHLVVAPDRRGGVVGALGLLLGGADQIILCMFCYIIL